MQILDGKIAAKAIREKVAAAIAAQDIQPRLATVLVGNDPASQIYVRNKQKDCGECGIKSVPITLEESTPEDALVAVVKGLSADPYIHGILVQLPLPAHISKDRVIQAIAPMKDVDCFTPENAGLLFQGTPRYLSCTPGGVMELLKFYGIELEGKNCTVIGRSNLVGKPMAMLALQENATVTTCHSRTANLREVCCQADILISAVGKSGFVTPDMVKEGAVIVDVGINRNLDGKLCGDCSPAAYDKAKAYTPVPGGVGLMTRAMLMLNTARAAGVAV